MRGFFYLSSNRHILPIYIPFWIAVKAVIFQSALSNFIFFGVADLGKSYNFIDP